MEIIHIHFKVCSCIYRICSNRKWGTCEYGTILQLYFDNIFLFTFQRSLGVKHN